MDEVAMAALRRELLRVTRERAPCPTFFEFGEAIRMSRDWVAKAMWWLHERGRLEIEQRGRAIRRLRIRTESGWSPWTDWTSSTARLSAERFIDARLNRRGELVASTATLAERVVMSPTRARLVDLTQRYGPATAARMAGLRPRDWDLVSG